MKYKIIHLVGIKVECVTDVIAYLDAYSHPHYEILEEHANIYIASQRETELQRELGYISALKPFFYDLFWGKKAQRIKHFMDGTCRGTQFRNTKGFKTNRGGTRSCNMINVCPKCGKTFKGPVYYAHINKDKCCQKQ